MCAMQERHTLTVRLRILGHILRRDSRKPVRSERRNPVSLTTAQILLLSQIEINVAIVSASFPTLRPLLKNTPLSLSRTDAYGSSGFRGTIGSGPGINSNTRNRVKSGGQIELISYGGRNPATKQKSYTGGRSNTSEESILKNDGITKTTETTVDFGEDHSRNSAQDTHWADKRV
jgi:hypothetical protein